MIEQWMIHDGHVRRFIVQQALGGGWEVEEQLDSEMLSRSRYDDWHRVERAVRIRVVALQRSGWSVERQRSSTNR